MKKYLFAFVAMTLMAGNAYALNSPDDPGTYEGAGFTRDTDPKVYRIVRNPLSGVDSSAFATGDVLIWDTISQDGVTVNLVGNTDISVSNDAVAGVAVASIPTAGLAVAVDAKSDRNKDNWGVMITRGRALTTAGAEVITVGEGLRAGATAGQAAGIAGSTGTSASLGFALEASASGTNEIQVYVRTE